MLALFPGPASIVAEVKTKDIILRAWTIGVPETELRRVSEAFLCSGDSPTGAGHNPTWSDTALCEYIDLHSMCRRNAECTARFVLIPAAGIRHPALTLHRTQHGCLTSHSQLVAG
eukprot:1736628-Rhodomonas_salina.1